MTKPPRKKAPAPHQVDQWIVRSPFCSFHGADDFAEVIARRFPFEGNTTAKKMIYQNLIIMRKRARVSRHAFTTNDFQRHVGAVLALSELIYTLEMESTQ